MSGREMRLIRYEDVYQYAFKGANRGDLEDEDFDAIVNAIESVSAVDAVEVVRCYECKKEGTEDCPMVHRSEIFGNLWSEGKSTGFCSQGERKDGAES